MKILAINWQCIKNPLSGGAEIHFHEIFKRIAAKGNHVVLLVSTFENAKPEEIIDGIHIIRHGHRNTFNFTVKKFYKQIAAREQFDIVIDDINKIPFYSPAFVKEPLLAISHHFFGKSIFREASPIAGLYVVIAEWLMKFFYNKTPFVVVSQSTLDDFIRKGYNPDNFSIIYNAIDKGKFPFGLTAKSAHPTVVYFGRLKKYKSVDHLLRAFAEVLQQFPDAELQILGKGDYRKALEKLAQKLNITKSITFFGFVPDEDKARHLTSAFVAVNTSMKEGWGITNIETNACGTPVISANVPGLKDSVKDGVSGLLYQYGNIKELADKIKLVLTDNNLRQKLSEGAVQWASTFSWDVAADQMLQKCRKTINEHKNSINNW